MRRSGSRSNWMLILAGVAALLAGVYALLSQRAVVTGSSVPVFYPAVMLYNYTATSLATAIVLAAVIIIGLWVPQALRRRPRYQLNALAAGLAVVASVLACWSTLPQTLAPYRHIDRAELNGRVYQLGVRLTATGENYYVLCDCDRLGVLCGCRFLPEAGQPEFTERPDLVADPVTNTLSIRIGLRMIYQFQP